jgi:hypothetical protein
VRYEGEGVERVERKGHGCSGEVKKIRKKEE